MCSPSFDKNDPSKSFAASARIEVIAANNRRVFGFTDRVDDLGIVTQSRRLGLTRRVLGIDENDRRARRAGVPHPLLNERAKMRFVNAGEAVVGPDLPDHQLRPMARERIFSRASVASAISPPMPALRTSTPAQPSATRSVANCAG